MIRSRHFLMLDLILLSSRRQKWLGPLGPKKVGAKAVFHHNACRLAERRLGVLNNNAGIQKPVPVTKSRPRTSTISST
jgi:hypothetical protein